MSRAVIFANGLVPEFESARRLIQPGDTLIAVDGGTHHTLAMGFLPSVVIGDLDSLTVDDRQQIIEKGVRLLKYPADKNQTDLELALEYTIQQGFREILIVGALGGRLDQTLGNLFLLADPRLLALDVRLDDGVEEAFFVRGRSQVRGQAGDTVSLIPWDAPVTGVITDRLRWPLRGETLFPEKTRGISNELLGNSAEVSLESGLLLVVHRRNRQP
jgi:thiamine pyrophosphokinase